MCADLGDWQAPESLLMRISHFIDREWPATGWIVALFLTVAIAVACGGCVVKKAAGTEVPASNPGFEVARLFDVDGCTVYRFYDSRYVYFTKCGAHTDTSWRRICGKNCVRSEVVSTDTQP